jgi:hypothetical protein
MVAARPPAAENKGRRAIVNIVERDRAAVTPKQPVLLVVLIETAAFAWRIAAINPTGAVHPLMRSEAGDLALYRGASFDEQVSFLRHRLSGVLQRGCDRLWGRQMKPSQIVFVSDALFADASPELTQAVADHFAEWMVNPAVAFYVGRLESTPDNPLRLAKLAGDISAKDHEVLECGLAALHPALSEPEAWEVAASKPQA